MKKITLLFIAAIATSGFAQQKTTGPIALSNSIPITANFTLNNTTSQVTLVLTGPSDRWFGLGIGVVQGFGMSDGDAVVFSNLTTPNLTDRNYIGFQQPAQDASQSWATVSNNVSSGIRTLVLTRSLTNSDPEDFQLPYATTNSISFAGVRPPSVTMNVASTHSGIANVGYASNIPFTTLGVEDFSLNATQIFPNPSNGEFMVKTKTTLEKINIYTQTGAFVKTITVEDASEAVEVKINGLATGVYMMELVNENEKSWKKIIVN